MIGRWLDKLFEVLSGNSPAEHGRGLDSNTIATWHPQVWIIALAFLAAVLLVGFVGLRDASKLRRRWVLVGIRCVLVALVLLMMHGWMRYEYRTNLPDLLVLIDDSQSMQGRDYYADRTLDQTLAELLKRSEMTVASRANLLKAMLLDGGNNLLERLQKRYNIQLYFVGRTARRSSDDAVSAVRNLQPTEKGSHLGDSLRQVLQLQRGRPTAAVLYFTDGNTTHGPSISNIASYAKQRSIPMVFFGVGSETIPTDLRVADVLTQPTAFVDDLLHFDAQIVGDGQYPIGFRARVQLLRQGTAKPLDERSVAISPNGSSANVRLRHRPPKAGKWRYTVRVLPIQNEADTNNNHVTKEVDVRDETIRVMLVQEYPSPEFRFLKSLLERQTQRGTRTKSIALTTVLQEADPEFADQDASAIRSLPIERAAFYKYDVIIFGDVNRQGISDEQLGFLESFVSERGGGLVVIAGARHTPQSYRGTPLARILPVRLADLQRPDPSTILTDGFRVAPTNLGLATAPLQLGDTPEQTIKIWNSFPPVYWHLSTPDVRPAARVLATHPTQRTSAGRKQPLITLQVVGSGKVVFHNIDSSYRWSRSLEGTEYYQRYWLQLLRYLSHRQLLGRTRRMILVSDHTRYRSGDAVQLQVRFLDDGTTPDSDDGVTVAIQKQGGSQRELRLIRHPINRNVFTGQIANLPSGNFRAWVTRPALKEAPAARSFEILPQVGEDGKKFMDAKELRLAAKKSAGKFLTFRNMNSLEDTLPQGKQVRIESLPPVSVWNSSFFAILFVTLIVSEWLLRKQGGLR